MEERQKCDGNSSKKVCRKRKQTFESVKTVEKIGISTQHFHYPNKVTMTEMKWKPDKVRGEKLKARPCILKSSKRATPHTSSTAGKDKPLTKPCLVNPNFSERAAPQTVTSGTAGKKEPLTKPCFVKLDSKEVDRYFSEHNIPTPPRESRHHDTKCEQKIKDQDCHKTRKPDVNKIVTDSSVKQVTEKCAPVKRRLNKIASKKEKAQLPSSYESLIKRKSSENLLKRTDNSVLVKLTENISEPLLPENFSVKPESTTLISESVLLNGLKQEPELLNPDSNINHVSNEDIIDVSIVKNEDIEIGPTQFYNEDEKIFQDVDEFPANEIPLTIDPQTLQEKICPDIDDFPANKIQSNINPQTSHHTANSKLKTSNIQLMVVENKLLLVTSFVQEKTTNNSISSLAISDVTSIFQSNLSVPVEKSSNSSTPIESSSIHITSNSFMDTNEQPSLVHQPSSLSTPNTEKHSSVILYDLCKQKTTTAIKNSSSNRNSTSNPSMNTPSNYENLFTYPTTMGTDENASLIRHTPYLSTPINNGNSLLMNCTSHKNPVLTSCPPNDFTEVKNENSYFIYDPSTSTNDEAHLILQTPTNRENSSLVYFSTNASAVTNENSFHIPVASNPSTSTINNNSSIMTKKNSSAIQCTSAPLKNNSLRCKSKTSLVAPTTKNISSTTTSNNSFVVLHSSTTCKSIARENKRSSANTFPSTNNCEEQQKSDEDSEGEEEEESDEDSEEVESEDWRQNDSEEEAEITVSEQVTGDCSNVRDKSRSDEEGYDSSDDPSYTPTKNMTQRTDSQESSGFEEDFSDEENASTDKIQPDVTPKKGSKCNVYEGIIVEQIGKGESKAKHYCDKSSFCFYCGNSSKKLPQHLQRIHKDEVLVIDFVNLPLNSRTRREAIANIRKLGNELHNRQVLESGSGILIPKKRKRTKVNPSELNFCYFCKGMYDRKTISEHYKLCIPKNADESTATVNARTATRLGKTMISPTPIASKIWADVLVGLRDDDISEIVKGDELIRDLAVKRYMMLGSGSSHQKNIENIKAKVRLCGRLVIEFRKQANDEKLSYTDLIHPAHQEHFFHSVWEICGFDHENFQFKSPSTANKIFQLTQAACDMLNIQAMKKGDSPTIKQVDRFKIMTSKEWRPLVERHVYNTLYMKKFNIPALLPLTEDIVKVNTFLFDESKTLRTNLLLDFCDKDYASLQKNVLARMIDFNRRRVGEIESFKTEWLPAPGSDLQLAAQEHELIKKLSDFERRLVDYMKLVQIRGKRDRRVPVILPKNPFQDVELLIALREEYGLTKDNPFLFGCKGSTKHLRGSPILRSVAVSAQTSKPFLLTSTYRRKQIATGAQLWSLDTREQKSLAQFMGHDFDVHKAFYQQPQDHMHLANISKLFLAAESGRVAKFRKKKLDEIEVGPNETVPLTQEEEDEIEKNFVENLFEEPSDVFEEDTFQELNGHAKRARKDLVWKHKDTTGKKKNSNEGQNTVGAEPTPAGTRSSRARGRPPKGATRSIASRAESRISSTSEESPSSPVPVKRGRSSKVHPTARVTSRNKPGARGVRTSSLRATEMSPVVDTPTQSVPAKRGRPPKGAKRSGAGTAETRNSSTLGARNNSFGSDDRTEECPMRPVPAKRGRPAKIQQQNATTEDETLKTGKGDTESTEWSTLEDSTSEPEPVKRQGRERKVPIRYRANIAATRDSGIPEHRRNDGASVTSEWSTTEEGLSQPVTKVKKGNKKFRKSSNINKSSASSCPGNSRQ